MKRLAFFALALVALTGQALATTYTSTKSSTWSDTTAWTPTPPAGGPSGDGNLVILANGFTITIDSAAGAGQNGNVTIGDSATPANNAISNAASGTGVLVVNSGCTLTVLSNVLHRGSATWTFNAGSSLVFNHASTSPVWTVSESGQNAKLVFSGSSGSHCTVSSSAAAKGRIAAATGSTTSANFDATYTDFTSVGDASNNAVTSYHNSSSGRLNLANCTFTSCGRVELTFTNGASYINVDSNTWTSTVATRCFVPTSTQAKTSGTRVINNNYFDVLFGNSSTLQDYTITGNAFASDLSILASSTAPPWAQFSGNLLWIKSTAGKTLPGQILASNPSNYWTFHDTAGSLNNLHAISVSTYLNGSVEFGGNVIEPGNTDSQCDMIMTTTANAATTLTIKNNILLPNANGVKAGDFLSFLGDPANLTVVCEHNTFVTDGTGETGIHWGETVKARVGLVSSCRSNLGWSYTANNGPLIQSVLTAGGGTVATNGTTAVVGTGTVWSTGNNSSSSSRPLITGDWIRVGTDTVAYQVASVTDDTHLTLQTAYPTTRSGITWEVVVKDVAYNAGFTAVDYNGKWNPYSGTDGAGYNCHYSWFTLFSYTPGGNDVTLSADPFVDRTRNIGTWAIAKGQALPSDSYNTRITAAYAYVKANPAVRIADLVRYVKAGWSVKRISLKNAGHDGATIGALPYVSPGSGAAILPAASNPPRRLKPAA